jgi:molybdopterin synthase sulfur carrier subunit
MEVLLFGIVREIVGADKLSIPAEAQIEDVAGLRTWLGQNYPQFNGLSSLAVAVDNEYAEDGQPLNNATAIALIPPVSGG